MDLAAIYRVSPPVMVVELPTFKVYIHALNLSWPSDLCQLTYRVVPHGWRSWFISPITMVYDTYNYSIHWVYKPTNITGGATLYHFFLVGR